MLYFLLSSRITSKMCQQTVLRSSVMMTIVVILTISNLGLSSASSLRTQDGYWWSRPDLGKRNSWWSKKSVDSAPEYLRDMTDSPYEGIALDGAARRQDFPGLNYLFRCYVTECVSEFVTCVQKSSTLEESSDCKKRHEVCADICGAINRVDNLV